MIVYYHIHVIYIFFYNNHSLEIKDLQPWTKCSHNSDDIQRMAIFSGSSDMSHILGHAVAFQCRDFLYTPLLSCGIHDRFNWHLLPCGIRGQQSGSTWHAQILVDACDVKWVYRRAEVSKKSFAFICSRYQHY